MTPAILKADTGLDWLSEYRFAAVHVGMGKDLRKYGAAMRLGWTVYRCDYALIRSGEAYDTIRAVCRNMEQRNAPAPSTA